MNIVIVGAGVAGLAIGWRLRQAGADVTILERGRAGRGASWAAAGMIAVAGEMGSAQTPEAEFGQHASRLWPDFATELEAASGRAVAFRRDGALMIARDAGEFARLQSWSGVERLTTAQARAKEPMLRADIAGALWAPDEARVDNRALGTALAVAFTRAGGTLSEMEAAVRFDVHEGAVVAVHTPYRRYAADAFILAAGAWSGTLDGLPPEALPPVRPVKGEMIAITPPAGTRLPRQAVWGNDVYLVPRTDRLLIGATVAEAGFDTGVTEAGADWLSKRAIALMPALATWEIVERWAGLRPGSPDGLPILGPATLRGLFIATGQFRNGILFAPSVAEYMSRLVLEHAAADPAFDPRRFEKRSGST